jgi:hypothetical protein
MKWSRGSYRCLLGDGVRSSFCWVFETPVTDRLAAGCLRLFRHHLSESTLGASPRHRYGRNFISKPMPTIPSRINTSSPITIQPCNASRRGPVTSSSFELMTLAQRCSASDPIALKASAHDVPSQPIPPHQWVAKSVAIWGKGYRGPEFSAGGTVLNLDQCQRSTGKPSIFSMESSRTFR